MRKTSTTCATNPFYRAFTLIELLVTVGVIAVLGGLLLPALSRARANADRIACVANMKQFGVALQLYASDNADELPPNLDGQDIPLGQAWVEGWLGLPGPDCTNVLLLKRSLLGPYVTDPKLWRCPTARPATVGRVTQPRVRTLSLNCFMGSPVKSPSVTTYKTMGEITRPSPAQALTFFEERVETINDGSFAMQWAFDENRPAVWVLRDKPGIVHQRAANLTFADGHVETHHWEDERTIKAPRNDAPMPGNRDLLWMQQRATWRETNIE